MTSNKGITMKKSDWIILILGSLNGGTFSPAQLQKSLFLIKENLTEEIKGGFYEFVPYNYGPFCKDIYHDAEELENEGLININCPSDKKWCEYSITVKGLESYKRAVDKISSNAAEYIKKLVNAIKKLSFQQLISYIYNNYPTYKENSVFVSK